MNTMKINKMPVAMVLAAFWGVLLAATTASAAWSSIQYDDNSSEWWGGSKANVNGGADTDGYYYTSTKPGTGDWTLGTSAADNYSYEWRPAAAPVWGYLPAMKVWSANNAWFQVFNTTSADGGAAADVQMKIVLSEAITGAAWKPRPGITINASGLKAYSEYSLNGMDWTTAATYSVSGQPEDILNLSFAPTTELFLRLRTDAGGVFYSLNVGSVAFTAAPIPEPMSMALLGLGSLVCLRRRNRK